MVNWTNDNFSALNTTDFTEYIQTVNELSGNWFGIAILMSVFTISFVTLQGRRTSMLVDDIAASTFVTALVGVLLFFAGLISGNVMIMMIFALILSIAWRWFA